MQITLVHLWIWYQILSVDMRMEDIAVRKTLPEAVTRRLSLATNNTGVNRSHLRLGAYYWRLRGMAVKT